MDGHGSERINREEAEGADDGDTLGFNKRRKKNVGAEESYSEIRRAIDEVSVIVKSKPFIAEIVQDEGGNCLPNPCVDVPMRPFLSLCKLILQVLDKIGPTMAVLRMDVHNNIQAGAVFALVALQRLELLRDGNLTRYSRVVEFIEKEKSEGIARKGNSCCRAFVWLVRSLDFTVALLQRLAVDPDVSMERAVEESYVATLKPWHGWISSAAVKVALQLLPETGTFIDLLKKKDARHCDFKEEVQALVSSLVPLLEDVHRTLKSYGLDRLKSS